MQEGIRNVVLKVRQGQGYKLEGTGYAEPGIGAMK